MDKRLKYFIGIILSVLCFIPIAGCIGNENDDIYTKRAHFSILTREELGNGWIKEKDVQNFDDNPSGILTRHQKNFTDDEDNFLKIALYVMEDIEKCKNFYNDKKLDLVALGLNTIKIENVGNEAFGFSILIMSQVIARDRNVLLIVSSNSLLSEPKNVAIKQFEKIEDLQPEEDNQTYIYVFLIIGVIMIFIMLFALVLYYKISKEIKIKHQSLKTNKVILNNDLNNKNINKTEQDLWNNINGPQTIIQEDTSVKKTYNEEVGWSSLSDRDKKTTYDEKLGWS